MGVLRSVGRQELNAEFRNLSQQGRVLVEYVWVGGSGRDLRSKTYEAVPCPAREMPPFACLTNRTWLPPRACSKVVEEVPTKPEDLPIWNYDGSSTGQAPGHDSEVLIKYSFVPARLPPTLPCVPRPTNPSCLPLPPTGLWPSSTTRSVGATTRLCSAAPTSPWTMAPWSRLPYASQTHRPKPTDQIPLHTPTPCGRILQCVEDLATAGGVTGNNTRDAAVAVFSNPIVAEQVRLLAPPPLAHTHGRRSPPFGCLCFAGVLVRH